MKRRLLSLVLALFCAGIPAVVATEPNRNNPEAQEKKIALTFDDGPHESYTQEILGILKKHGIRATFFIIGENAERYPDRIQTIAKDGHELGNHTYTHASVNKLSPEELAQQLEDTSRVLERLTGKRPTVFRPPFGAYNDRCVEQITALGYRCVLWSQDSRDWQLPPVQQIISSMEAKITTGDILLFHDFNRENSPTPKALEELIPKLLASGYQFVTVSELFSQNF